MAHRRDGKRSRGRGEKHEAEPPGRSLPVRGGRFQVAWDIYHGVPVGWTRGELVALHRQLGGEYSIDGDVGLAKGVRKPTSDRMEWIEYKQTLYRIADGVRAGDPACVELAVRYIELRFIGSYSGYIRALLARRLKHVELSPEQKDRLIKRFQFIESNREYTTEFAEYARLWIRIDGRGPGFE